jgi:hypothetical protein
MRQKLFNVAAAASMGLCLVAAAFAIRGIWRSDSVSYNANTWTAMASANGSSTWLTLWFDSNVQIRGFATNFQARRGLYFGDLPANEMDWLGFSVFTGRTDASTTSPFGGNRPYGTVVVPHWMVATSAAVLPGLWMIKWYRRGFGAGRCRRCGYDLRATPDRCPECGTSPAVGTEGA